MTNVITVKNLNKNFSISIQNGLFKTTKKTINAVSNISFSVKEGEIVALLGPNGSGKSTTIKMLTGILTPTSGIISVLNLSPYKNRKNLSFQIGSVFGQKSQLWFHLPPIESFYLLGSIYDIPKNDLLNRINYLSDILDISNFLYTPVRKLSLGQRMRCEIIASLLHKPKIIFLDEPTIGLDIVSKKRLRSFIKKINKDEHVTIFLTSHDIGDIDDICKRIILINSGRMLLDKSLTELKTYFDKSRILDISFKDNFNINTLDIRNIKIKHYTSSNIKLETTIENIGYIIDNITTSNIINDIKISNKPLEDILENLYLSKDEL